MHACVRACVCLILVDKTLEHALEPPHNYFRRIAYRTLRFVCVRARTCVCLSVGLSVCVLCVSVCVWVSVCPCLTLSLSLPISVYPSLSLPVPPSLCLSLPLSAYPSRSLSPVSVLSVSVCLCLRLFLFLSSFLSFELFPLSAYPAACLPICLSASLCRKDRWAGANLPGRPSPSWTGGGKGRVA